MKKVFLETHNIKNQFSGFGQFNLHLLEGLFKCNDPEIQFVVHDYKMNDLKKRFGRFFKYRHYFGMTRYSLTSIRTKYDIWHSVNQNTRVEPFYDLPYLLTVHDVNFIDEISNDLNHPRNLLFKEKLKRANAITYISQYAMDSTHKYFEVPKIPEYIIYNGNPSSVLIDLNTYQPQFNCTSNYLFTIGDFLERKNFHILVQMMPYLKNYKLIIAGNNNRQYADKVRETITALNLEGYVTLIGRISEEEKQYHLKNCTAFVFPSLREGFGLPPIEAMRFGKPVFLANTTSLPEIGGEWAFYWDTFDPQEMAKTFQDGMLIFEKNKKKYQEELIKRGLSFNWEKTAQQYINVYKSLL